MLKEFSLKNYQSHKDSVLHFSPGLNAIVGASDSGKSAIMRALLAVISNSNVGIPEVSRWIKTPKKAIKKGEEMRLCLVNDSHTIERYRGDKNGYEIDGDALEAVGTSVPERISKALNISDVNIHQQDDPYFLLSSSNGEAGKYINKMVNLQEIDQFTSEMKSEINSISSLIEANAQKTKSIKEELESLEWVSEANALLVQIEALTGSMEADEMAISSLDASLAIYHENKKKLDEVEAIFDKASQLVKEIKAADIRVTKLAVDYANINKSLRAYDEAIASLAKFPDLDAAAVLIKEINEMEIPSQAEINRLTADLQTYYECAEMAHADHSDAIAAIALVKQYDKRIAAIKENINELDTSLRAWKTVQDSIATIDAKIEKTKSQIEELKPLICPTCGQMRKDHEH